MDRLVLFLVFLLILILVILVVFLKLFLLRFLGRQDHAHPVDPVLIHRLHNKPDPLVAHFLPCIRKVVQKSDDQTSHGIVIFRFQFQS